MEGKLQHLIIVYPLYILIEAEHFQEKYKVKLKLEISKGGKFFLPASRIFS